MVAWPDNLGEQVIILHSLWDHQVALVVFLLVLCGCINMLEQCAADALIATLNVEVVPLILGTWGS